MGNCCSNSSATTQNLTVLNNTDNSFQIVYTTIDSNNNSVNSIQSLIGNYHSTGSVVNIEIAKNSTFYVNGYDLSTPIGQNPLPIRQYNPPFFVEGTSAIASISLTNIDQLLTNIPVSYTSNDYTNVKSLIIG